MSGLPKGWVEVSFPEIADILDSRRVPLNGPERAKRKGTFPYYGANGLVDHIDGYLFEGPHVLLAEDGGHFDEPERGVAYTVDGQFWVNNHAHILKPAGGMDTGFLCAWLNATDWVPYVGGSTRAKLTQAGLGLPKFGLPPLAEQRRIVAKLDALTARTARARADLDRIPALAARYKQAVLAKAFSGELTADWRGETEFRQEEGALPYGWRSEELQSLASDQPRSIQSGPFGSNLRHSEFRPEGRLVIGIDNVQDGRFSLGSNHRISQSKFEELEKYRARPGDVAITVMATVGRTCVIPDDIEPAIITKHIYRITLNREVADPYFVMNALRGAQPVLAQMGANVRGQTRPGINGSILKTLMIPTAPLKEQKEIVRRIDRTFAEIDRMVSEATAARRLLDRLDQAVLAKAFRGELVPQDPADEPASVLLDRIRAERAAAPKARRGRKPALA